MVSMLSTVAVIQKMNLGTLPPPAGLVRIPGQNIDSYF